MSTVSSGNVQDIDALLAEADSLMDGLATAMAEDDPADDAARADEESGGDAGDASAPGIESQVDDLPDFAADTDADAVAPELGGGGDAEIAAEDEIDQLLGKPSRKGTIIGPKSAPEEWLAEADLASAGHDAVEQLPHIPDTISGEPEGGEQTRAGAIRTRLVTTVGAVLALPVGVLVALDRPFAGLSLRIKACIGYAAIATLLVAAGTWVLGSRQTMQTLQ